MKKSLFEYRPDEVVDMAGIKTEPDSGGSRAFIKPRKADAANILAAVRAAPESRPALLEIRTPAAIWRGAVRAVPGGKFVVEDLHVRGRK